MLNYAETTSVSTIVPSTLDKQKITRSTCRNFDQYVPLSVGENFISLVSPTLMDGYLAACKAYREMEEQTEYGAYGFLTGYEYAHLARQYAPLGLSCTDQREWQRGFIVEWNASLLGFEGH